MADFTSTGISYLIRRTECGGYYWQAKIAGASRRGSLKTKSQSVAKSRLHAFMAKARARYEGASGSSSKREDLKTVRDWCGEWVRIQEARPRLKTCTKKECAKLIDLVLRDSKWADLPIEKLKESHLSDWWVTLCGRLGPVSVNARLRVLKAAFRNAVDQGAIARNPAEKLERLRIPDKLIEVPSLQDIENILISVRSQNKSASAEVADMIEFYALTGLRPAELRALKCEDVKEKWIAVRGGDEGTKNRREREVPIMAELEELIERRQIRSRSGPVFSVKSPYRALRRACERLGLKPMRVYDIRHYFVTVCVEQGVDVPTVALWVGHTDGGALLMKTYTHIRRRHSLAQAARVRFTERSN